MSGSWMLIREVSKEACLARLSKDVYAQQGVWDMSKVRCPSLTTFLITLRLLQGLAATLWLSRELGNNERE